MLSIIGSLVGPIVKLFTGDFANKLADAYKAKSDAKTEQDRINAEVTIARLEAANAARATGGKLIALAQFLVALIFIIYNFKVIVIDKVLGLGITDPLSPELYDLQYMVMAFLFGSGLVRTIK